MLPLCARTRRGAAAWERVAAIQAHLRRKLDRARRPRPGLRPVCSRRHFRASLAGAPDEDPRETYAADLERCRKNDERLGCKHTVLDLRSSCVANFPTKKLAHEAVAGGWEYEQELWKKNPEQTAVAKRAVGAVFDFYFQHQKEAERPPWDRLAQVLHSPRKKEMFITDEALAELVLECVSKPMWIRDRNSDLIKVTVREGEGWRLSGPECKDLPLDRFMPLLLHDAPLSAEHKARAQEMIQVLLHAESRDDSRVDSKAWTRNAILVFYYVLWRTEGADVAETMVNYFRDGQRKGVPFHPVVCDMLAQVLVPTVERLDQELRNSRNDSVRYEKAHDLRCTLVNSGLLAMLHGLARAEHAIQGALVPALARRIAPLVQGDYHRTLELCRMLYFQSQNVKQTHPPLDLLLSTIHSVYQVAEHPSLQKRPEKALVTVHLSPREQRQHASLKDPSGDAAAGMEVLDLVVERWERWESGLLRDPVWGTPDGHMALHELVGLFSRLVTQSPPSSSGVKPADRSMMRWRRAARVAWLAESAGRRLDWDIVDTLCQALEEGTGQHQLLSKVLANDEAVESEQQRETPSSPDDSCFSKLLLLLAARPDFPVERPDYWQRMARVAELFRMARAVEAVLEKVVSGRKAVPGGARRSQGIAPLSFVIRKTQDAKRALRALSAMRDPAEQLGPPAPDDYQRVMQLLCEQDRGEDAAELWDQTWDGHRSDGELRRRCCVYAAVALCSDRSRRRDTIGRGLQPGARDPVWQAAELLARNLDHWVGLSARNGAEELRWALTSRLRQAFQRFRGEPSRLGGPSPGAVLERLEDTLGRLRDTRRAGPAHAPRRQEAPQPRGHWGGAGGQRL
eukprot:TRINITY_DN66068_c0_g1_i1.p1 TRINITY_DN66068_c0_g1~~TRINITY_DN66068_c0_g1_i1.p1  ORF type:complete len:853 (+),score=250.87 TRINITY_DN66068_c0_g1_i1:76-2634(+)